MRLPGNKNLLSQFVTQVEDILLARGGDCECVGQEDYTSGTVFPCSVNEC